MVLDEHGLAADDLVAYAELEEQEQDATDADFLLLAFAELKEQAQDADDADEEEEDEGDGNNRKRKAPSWQGTPGQQGDQEGQERGPLEVGSPGSSFIGDDGLGVWSTARQRTAWDARRAADVRSQDRLVARTSDLWLARPTSG
jgi:hypothetical protein